MSGELLKGFALYYYVKGLPSEVYDHNQKSVAFF